MRLLVALIVLAELAVGLFLAFLVAEFRIGYAEPEEIAASRERGMLVALACLAVAAPVLWAAIARRAPQTRFTILALVGLAHAAVAVASVPSAGLVVVLLAAPGAAYLALAVSAVPGAPATR